MKLYKEQENSSAHIGQADPYMIKGEDGRFYMYTTGGNLFSSDELFQGWKYEGVCLDAPLQHSVWAPSVIYLDGKYYMYYSSIMGESDGDHGEGLRLAVSDSPHGPFGYVKDLLDPFTIDPHTVKTPSGIYIFYCINDYEAQRAGTLIVCDKMTDPYTLEGRPVRVVLPSIDEEIFQKNRFKAGQHWHTIEGAFYFYEKGYHYLMYSGACYQNPTYFIGYSTAKEVEDADLRSLSWQKQPSPSVYAPLMRKNSFVEGVGHNSVIFNQGKAYVVYHGRDYGDNRPGDARTARIDELNIDNGKLSVNMTP